MEQTPNITTGRQIVLYFGLFVGVFLSDAVLKFHRTASFNIDELWQMMNFGRLLMCSIIAIIIVPNVYEKVIIVNTKSPFIVQLGLFIQNGVFWSFIINTIGKS
jgi:hypothetical protein